MFRKQEAQEKKIKPITLGMQPPLYRLLRGHKWGCYLFTSSIPRAHTDVHTVSASEATVRVQADGGDPVPGSGRLLQ